MVASRFVTFLCLLCLGILVLGGCAKISEPQPPQVLVPKPATDLKVRQYADKILLSVSMPEENTNGSRTLALGEVEIFRLAVDRGNSSALPQAAFVAQAERIQLVQAEGLGRYLKDGMLNLWDSAASDPDKFYAQGFLYAVRFINRKNQTAGLSNQAYMAPVAIPIAPQEISKTLSRDSVRLTWAPPVKNTDGSMPARIAGYNVYRSEDPKAFPASPLNAEPLPQAEFIDRSFAFDKSYYYEVTVVGSRENPYAESLPSAHFEVATADVFPPGMPKNLAYVVEKGFVMLLWGAPDDTDVAGYRVYRTEEGSTERILLQEQLVTTLSFRDDKASPGKKYQYGVAAVDTHKNEGPAATVIVEVQ
jgi:hypothetical protein